MIAGISIAGCFAPGSLAKADTTSSTSSSVTEAEIDSYIKNASLEQKIGQMYVSRTPQTPGQAEKDVSKYNLGGLIVYDADMQGLTQDQFKAKMARYQKAAQIPLLIGVDQEGGLVSRLTHSGLVPQNGDQFAFPRKQYEDAEKVAPGSGMKAVTKYASETATLLRSLGINWNYAPDADYSDDPNSFIYERGFGGVMGPKSYAGEASYISQVIPAWQHDNLIAATLKHFPGYGDSADTHTSFAINDKSKEDIINQDMLPFKDGIKAGADSVMVTHVIYDKIDPDYPASLSKTIHTMLRQDCNFKGVIVTDALEMGAITDFAKQHGNISVDVLAVEAGNDMIMTTDYATGIPEIAKAVKDGQIPESQINNSVKRILEMKNKLHLLTPDDLNGNRKPADQGNPDNTNPGQPTKATKDFTLNPVQYNADHTSATISGTIPDSAVEGSMIMTLTDANTNKEITTTVVGGKGMFEATIPVTTEDQVIRVSSSDKNYKDQTIVVKGRQANPTTPTQPTTPTVPTQQTTPTVPSQGNNVNDNTNSSSDQTNKNTSAIEVINHTKATKTIMHVAKVYNKDGKAVAVKKAYQKVKVLAKVKIGSKTYYQIGKNQYILVGNIDGSLRKLIHNAYIYNNKGHRLNKKTLKKNTKLRTYGSKYKINHKTYYRIGRNQYVKAANF